MSEFLLVARGKRICLPLLLSIKSHRVRHDGGNLACMHALEKEMATHSSIPAWRIPGTEEPGGLPSMGWRGVGHDWSDLAAAAGDAEMQVRYLGWEDPWKEEIHSCVLAGKIPRTEEPGGLQSMGSQRVGTWQSTHTATASGSFIPLWMVHTTLKPTVCLSQFILLLPSLVTSGFLLSTTPVVFQKALGSRLPLGS